MRIGYFCAKFPYFEELENNEDYFCGGSIIAAKELIQEMVKKDVETFVFTTSSNNSDSVEEYGKLKIFRYGTKYRIFTANISFGMRKKPLMHEVDLVHTHFDIPPSPIFGYQYAKQMKRPLILTYHGDWLDNYGTIIRKQFVKYINNQYVDKILSFADIIISPSEQYIKESRFLGRYRNKIRVIPNGIDLTKYEVIKSKEQCRNDLNLDKNWKIILYLGALTPRKGPDVLIRSMQIIKDRFPDARLLIGGTGGMWKALSHLVEKYGLKSNVNFLGYIDEEFKPLYYKAADVFCLPSTISTEVFPLTLLEASAANLPLVVSDLETFQCFIEDGFNGLIVKRGDQNDLAEKICYLFADDEASKRMGKNAKDKVMHYSWEKIADQTYSLYEELLSS